MEKMFSNKEEFKEQFVERMIATYGRDLSYSRPSERYLVLGEMIKNYVADCWMESKNIHTF